MKSLLLLVLIQAIKGIDDDWFFRIVVRANNFERVLTPAARVIYFGSAIIGNILKSSLSVNFLVDTYYGAHLTLEPT